MTEHSQDEVIPADVRAVLELFSTQLAKVPFPDVDAASLRREVESIRTEAKAVADARAALDAAVERSNARLVALREITGRAIAYARIYSEAHPDRQPLAAALAAIVQPPVTPPPAKRRGRPRRSDRQGEMPMANSY